MLPNIKATASAVLLLAAAQINAAVGGAVSGGTRGSSASAAPSRYIVEFDTAAHLAQGLNGRKRSVGDQHERFYKDLTKRGVEYDVHAEYKAAGTFVGASVQISSAADLEHLSVAEGVVNIYEVHEVTRPQPRIVQVSFGPSGSGSNSTLGAVADAAAGASMPDRANMKRTTATGTYSDWSFLQMIQADQVHRQGNTGQGIKIAIVDSGIDYNHPAFGSCWNTPGCRVQGGYDLVGDTFNGPNNDRRQDPDPYSACNFHGTAVAGCAAGGDNSYDAPGVAPGAIIMPYRVFGCTGSTYSDIELEALLMAERDGADIINFSISSPPGFAGSALGVAAANLAKKGIQCVWASGNFGANGMLWAGSNGAEPATVAAASVDSAGDHSATVTFTGSDTSVLTFQTSAAFPFDPTLGPRQLYYTTSEICSGFPADAPPSLANYVVLVSRGTCLFSDKAQRAKDRGARVIFFVNNRAGLTVPSGTDDILPNAMLLQADGVRLRNGLASGVTYTVTFSQQTIYTPRATAGQLSDFSSIGPSYDGYYTSKLAAPGYNVLAPYPGNRWTITSGTSFASPITAGAIALMMKAQQNAGKPRDLVAIRDALFASAGSVQYKSSGKSESAATVGSGLVQVFNALNAGTKVTPTLLSLNDTEFFQGTKYITVTNTDTKANTYRLTHQSSNLMYGLDSTKNLMSNGPAIQHDASDAVGATVKFSRTTFTLNPGQSTIVLISFTAPSGVDAGRLPIYSGSINIAGGPLPLHVTYMGAATKYRTDIRMMSTRNTIFNTPSPAMLLGSTNTAASSGQTFNFATNSNTSTPTVLFLQLTATRRLIYDLVDANANIGVTSQYRRDLDLDLGPVERQVDNDASPKVRRRVIGIDNSNSASAAKRHRRSRSAPATAKRQQSSASRQQNAVLKLWCQYTNYKGRGCVADSGSNNKPNTYAQVPITGNIAAFYDQARDHNNVNGDDEGGSYTYLQLVKPLYMDGTRIPNGSYKFLVRLLRINGDPTQQADYDTWLSPAFSIQA